MIWMAELTLPQYNFTDDDLAEVWSDVHPQDQEAVDAAIDNQANILAFDEALANVSSIFDLDDVVAVYLPGYEWSRRDEYTYMRDNAESIEGMDEVVDEYKNDAIFWFCSAYGEL